VPDHIEDELQKLRERIAQQKRKAEAGISTDDVEVEQHGTSVVFSIPDDDELDE
jgi:hypothetical protein